MSRPQGVAPNPSRPERLGFGVEPEDVPTFGFVALGARVHTRFRAFWSSLQHLSVLFMSLPSRTRLRGAPVTVLGARRGLCQGDPVLGRYSFASCSLPRFLTVGFSKMSLAPSSSCLFQALIWLACTSYCWESSATVFSLLGSQQVVGVDGLHRRQASTARS